MKKFDIASNFANVSKNAADMLGKAKDKAIKVMDQNDDGVFDLKDISEISDAVNSVAQKTVATIKKNVNERARTAEEKSLLPFFEEDLEDAAFNLTKLIRICEKDKKHSESEICKGSIGHFTEQKEFKLINIYKENLDKFNISLYPDASYEFYYVNPCDRDHYIALEEYFSYLKLARVSELQKIAQSLGAKHFRVTYHENESSSSARLFNANANVRTVANVGVEALKNENSKKSVEIAAEMTCIGHAPERPQLEYLKHDRHVLDLIEMRLKDSSPSKQSFGLKLSSLSGIKENDAVKIDAVMSGMKCSGGADLVREAKNETQRYLEYEIEF